MQPEQIKKAYEHLIEIQKNIIEIQSSAKGEVRVILNGNVQITSLYIHENLNMEQANPILVETINIAIKNVSLKIQQAIVTLQQQIPS